MIILQIKHVIRPGYNILRLLSTHPVPNQATDLQIQGKSYQKDDYTNVTPKILSLLERKLHNQPHHPLCLVKQRIVDYFYKTFKNARRNPIFSVYDNLNPIVTVGQNFDSLLIPKGHVSRAKSDCYYINRDYLLRAHTTSHQSELIRSGLDAFLVTGDVYRRDEIDSTHYPVFHQIDAVKLYTKEQLFPKNDGLELFEKGNSCESGKQECHTLETMKILEYNLKSSLGGLAKSIFGPEAESRWVETQFPFTAPSWELEVKHKGDWLELLGCGIMKQQILTEAGVYDQVGWAFGIGIERIAMKLYQIPDIRLFWSNDSGFLNQFKDATPQSNIIYKAVSQYPQCTNDISFWLPVGAEYNSNDFYDLVRSIGGDIIEQVTLVDNFVHPKTKCTSHCYRIVYRHMEKTLTQEEVNVVHKEIENVAKNELNVKIR